MKIHEYQAKEVLRRYGVATPRGRVTDDAAEARAICEELGGRCVVKAQIHAGGRGKGGGVKLADSLDEVRDLADQILGMTLVTHQTGPEGKEVKRLLIEEGAPIKDELYVGLVVDRASQRVTVMASSEGGTEIETVAEETPELIHKVSVDPKTGLTDDEASGLAQKIGIPAGLVLLVVDQTLISTANWIVTVVYVVDIGVRYRRAGQPAPVLSGRVRRSRGYQMSGVAIDVLAAFPFYLVWGTTWLVLFRLLKLVRVAEFMHHWRRRQVRNTNVLRLIRVESSG